MTLMQKLITWQQEQARKEHLEPYMVLQFNTIKEIIRLQPKTKEDLLRVKGIGPAKVHKYGDAILGLVRGDSIVNGTSAKSGVAGDLFSEAQAVNELAAHSAAPQQQVMRYDQETGEIIEEKDAVVSVTDFVTMMDTLLRTHFRSVRIRGEVVGFKRNASGHAYFEIKDQSSVMRCMLFRDRYDLAGVSLEDGMEIIITGYPNYHRQYGFGFVGTMVELYGEGALKKAYEELKKQLDQEGLLAPQRKRAVPKLPERIGLITSRTGAAIGDFTTNVGQYGYTIIFHQSRVEGSQAIDDLMAALAAMAKKNLDVLVIVRGGGSLESLQAFNNEKIVRMIAEFPVPVIVGVGHEQDETLTTLVADCGVSTPTAAARAVRESWDQCGEFVRNREQVIVHLFDKMMRSSHEQITDQEYKLTAFLDNMVTSCHDLFRRFSVATQSLEKAISYRLMMISTKQMSMIQAYERMIRDARVLLSVPHITTIFHTHIAQQKKYLQIFEQSIFRCDPQRLLMRGYGIVRDARGKIVRSKNEVHAGDHVTVQVSDGEISAEIQ